MRVSVTVLPCARCVLAGASAAQGPDGAGVILRDGRHVTLIY